MNNFSDPEVFLKALFKIVGHDENESQELITTFVDGAKKKSILICYTKLSDATKREIDEMLSRGEKVDEIISKILKELGPAELQKIVTGESFKMMKEYVTTIRDKLSDAQKLSVAHLINGDRY